MQGQSPTSIWVNSQNHNFDQEFCILWFLMCATVLAPDYSHNQSLQQINLFSDLCPQSCYLSALWEHWLNVIVSCCDFFFFGLFFNKLC